MRAHAWLLLLTAAALGCRTAESRAGKAANTVQVKDDLKQVRHLLGEPHYIQYVAPNIEEWYYYYQDAPPSRYLTAEPIIRTGPPPGARLIVRFENKEVVSWRRPSE